MSSEPELRLALQRIQAPDELDALRRAWPLVLGAFESREEIDWRRRNFRPLLAAAVGVVILAAAISSPGRALVGSVRDTVSGSKHVKAGPALTSLPTPGELLVNSKVGPWIVHSDGSKRLLAPWWAGSWSPQAKYVVVTRGHEVAAVDPNDKGAVHWSIERSGMVRAARWSPDGFRVAYLNGKELRVVAGDGTGDAVVRQQVGATPPAWRPQPGHELAFATVDGRIELVETDSAKTVWRTVAGEPPTHLVWSEDGERLLVLGERSLRVLDVNGKRLQTMGLAIGASGVAFVRKSHRFVMVRYSPATGRSDLVLLQAEANAGEPRFLYSAPGDFGSLAISPNGNWLLVGWINADQWLFLRLTAAAKITAVSNIAEQFGAETRTGPLASVFPPSVSWCCPPSP